MRELWRRVYHLLQRAEVRKRTRRRSAPANPARSLYNDDVQVGRVHGGKFLEFVSFDPQQGATFYVRDLDSNLPVFALGMDADANSAVTALWDSAA